MKRRPLWLMTALLVLTRVPAARAGHVTNGPDVKVTNDNNADGGTPNPGFDARNRPSNETTAAISPANPSAIAAGADDYRMWPAFGDVWLGVSFRLGFQADGELEIEGERFVRYRLHAPYVR